MSALDKLLAQAYGTAASATPAGTEPVLANQGHGGTSQLPTNQDEPPMLASAVDPDDDYHSHDFNRSARSLTSDNEAAVCDSNADTSGFGQVDGDAREHDVAGLPLPERSFKPHWEVDSFLWPAVSDAIRRQLGDELPRAARAIAAEYQRVGLRALLITSAHSGAGRTSITLALAKTLADLGKSVAIVDLDHRQPVLAEQLGVIVERGLEALQEEQEAPDSICVASLEDRMTLVPLVEPTESTYCLQNSVHDAFEVLARHHDLVLVDVSAEVTELLAHHARLKYGMILVEDAREESAEEAMIYRLQSMALHPVAVMQNRAA